MIMCMSIGMDVGMIMYASISASVLGYGCRWLQILSRVWVWVCMDRCVYWWMRVWSIFLYVAIVYGLGMERVRGRSGFGEGLGVDVGDVSGGGYMGAQGVYRRLRVTDVRV